MGEEKPRELKFGGYQFWSVHQILVSISGGTNSRHGGSISRHVRLHGCFLHNIERTSTNTYTCGFVTALLSQLTVTICQIDGQCGSVPKIEMVD